MNLNAEQQRERRKELARRLMEINARKREQKVRVIIVCMAGIVIKLLSEKWLKANQIAGPLHGL